jgi:hypothetical protein
MADINDRFNVVLTIDIQKLGADGVATPFDLTVKTLFDCPRTVMHSVETALGEALIELGDQGIVMLGGEEGAAMLEAAKGAKDKVRGKSAEKKADKFER